MWSSGLITIIFVFCWYLNKRSKMSFFMLMFYAQSCEEYREGAIIVHISIIYLSAKRECVLFKYYMLEEAICIFIFFGVSPWCNNYTADCWRSYIRTKRSKILKRKINIHGNKRWFSLIVFATSRIIPLCCW